MTICWVFAAITVAAAGVAAFVGDLRRAALALWVAGLSIGAIYLTLGAEVLAVIQWVVSTLGAITFVFYSSNFGEHGPREKLHLDRRLAKVVLGVLAGGAFAWIMWTGAGQLPNEPLSLQPVEGTDVLAIGHALTGQNLVALEVLALTLFLVLIGGGVIARPDVSGKGESEPADATPEVPT